MREVLDARLSERYCKAVLEPETKNNFDISFEIMIDLNIAYAVMLYNVNLIDKQTASSLIGGFETVRKSMTKDDIDGNLEGLYFNVERRMFAVVGSDTGGKIHTGRSRNDISAVMARLEIRPTLFQIMDLLLELQGLLIEKSKDNIETVITGYTHSQPGQPITLAHYYLGVFGALTRDFDRIISAYHCLNRSPYGAAAFAGSSFMVDRHMLARLLGFNSIIKNTLDSNASRDYILETLSAYSILASTVSRVATDLQFWATFENGILEIGGQAAGCSSIMPQKRNPILLETARHKASYVYGGLMSALAVLNSIPYNFSIDVSSAGAAYFPAAKQMEHSMICLIETIKYSRIRGERALDNARINMCTVTSLAEYMVEKSGITFTQAHDIVGNIVSIVIKNHTFISGITPELIKAESEKALGKAIDLSQQEIEKVLDPIQNVQGKTTLGGPQSASLLHMLEEGEKRLKEQTTAVGALKDNVEKARERLKNEAGSICE